MTLCLRASKASATINPTRSIKFGPVIVDPDLFVRVLSSFRTSPRMALRLFRWAESQPGFRRSEFVFCAILEILAQNNLMRSAYWVMERVINANMHRIVDVLIGGCVSSEVSVKILDLLIWVYSKKSMVEQCLSVFDKMIKSRLSPDVKNCNRILRILRDKDLMSKAVEVYRTMGEFGIKPTIVTYNTLLDSYCKGGKVQQGLDLLSEMQRRGCAPNDVTYNVLINGLSKKGEFEQAKGLIGEMLKTGLKVSAYTYNPLIYGYFNKGMLAEALSLQEEMVLKGASPTVATYNSFIYGLCKLGRMSDAMQQLSDMLANNLLPDVVSYNTLIYGKWVLQDGSLSMAQEFFDEMLHEGLELDSYAYATRIVGELKLGDTSRAFSLQEEMLAKGFPPDLIIYNVVVDGLCKLGIWKKHLNCCKRWKGREIFYEMLSKGLTPSVVTYTVLIHGHAGKGRLERAFIYFSEMQEKGLNFFAFPLLLQLAIMELWKKWLLFVALPLVSIRCSNRDHPHDPNKQKLNNIKVHGTSTMPTAKVDLLSQTVGAATALTSVSSIAENGHITKEQLRQNIPTKKQFVDPYRQGLIVEGGVGYSQTVVIRSYEVGPDKTATLESILNFCR
ncbi:Pentatricopeptide repeat-containing protein, mitochondrial [Vitis vinifera]|uniref:Pentatricopeptide repeat-containing protein, mitochondrial n=1 Tax=Vitis vinifera TaxID=29760 RepID=A0A438C126_VITVI|nr:Pentatricopeptide repeat-containing protein, mitochondrial [Vitis vinifera]